MRPAAGEYRTVRLGDLRAAVRAIGELQSHLESAIEAEIVPGTNDAMPGRKGLLRSLRGQWAQSEGLVKRLEEARKNGR